MQYAFSGEMRERFAHWSGAQTEFRGQGGGRDGSAPSEASDGGKVSQGRSRGGELIPATHDDRNP